MAWFLVIPIPPCLFPFHDRFSLGQPVRVYYTNENAAALPPYTMTYVKELKETFGGLFKIDINISALIKGK